jgi:hypothetical protein
MSTDESPGHCTQPTVHDVDALVARAQHLIDSRPRDAYPLAWCIEASYIGDLPAIAMVAASAGGLNRPADRGKRGFAPG